MDDFQLVDGDILCHGASEGTYTDIGSTEEREILAELKREPWRDVVNRRFGARLPWLHRIILDPARTRMLDVLDLPPGGRFLDIGSGWGQLTIPLARRGEVYALDLTLARLRILREIARQEDCRVHLLRGDLRTFPLRENFFDLIVLNGVLEYTNLGFEAGDRAGHLLALRRVCSALTPRGSVYIGIENATGLKYLLGAPDDHTGRKDFTYLLDREEGAAARTWALDQYLQLFEEAGLELSRAYACFPDYKLIEHMVDLEEVDAFLLERGLPAHEHSGVDGAPLNLETRLDPIYRNLARMKLARYFVPSFGFVLERAGGTATMRRLRRQSARDAAEKALLDAGEINLLDAASLSVTRIEQAVDFRPDCRTERYTVELHGRPIASVKQIPLSGPFAPDAILGAYALYEQADSFRPPKLYGQSRDAQSLWLVEEFVAEAESLDALVAREVLSAEEATQRIREIIDTVWSFGRPVEEDLLNAELQACAVALRDLLACDSIADAISEAFRGNVMQRKDSLRTVVTTRDFIGRNILRTPDHAWVLIDYDLAHRTSLAPLGFARSAWCVPYCTETIWQAQVFEGLDRPLLEAAAVAMEFALQKRMLPPSREAELRRENKLRLLKVLAPGGMDEVQAELNQLQEEIRRAREYQAGLEAHVRALEPKYRAQTLPSVDIMVVSYNSARWLDGFLDSLRRLDYPAERLRLVFVDNGSRDNTLAKMQTAANDLNMPLKLIPTGQNLGFTGGYEHAFRYGDAEYYFVVNLDTVIEPDAITLLIQRLERDPKIGIAEARQAPREHPKYYDPITGETSWCSGACMMIRAKALRQIGGGFERSFFMYLEDIDLSWRMWLHGWKCIYVPEAVVQHFTEDLDPKKTPKTQHYYTMRNGALMRAMYGTRMDLFLHYLAMLRVGTISRNPLWHRWNTIKAMFASLRYLPAAVRGREGRGKFGRHRWVFFNGWTYGRHGRDLTLRERSSGRALVDLVKELPQAEKRLEAALPIEGHITRHPGASVGGESKPAILVYRTAEVTYQTTVEPGAELQGHVAIPQEAWDDRAVGVFTIHIDGQEAWRGELHPAQQEHRAWVPFRIAVTGAADAPRRITLRFDGNEHLGWGLWGGVRIAFPEQESAKESPLQGLSKPAISIVMPTHNRADQLPRVVERLMSQDVPPEYYEVIIVDSNSSDATPQVLNQLKAMYPNLSTLRCDRSSVASTRNMGLNVARAPLVLLLDDDILVGRDMLTRVFNTARRHPGRVLLARIAAPWQDSVDPFERFLWQSQDVNIYNFDDPENVPPNYFYTACVVIPRDVLGETRFDENFLASGVEDIEFGFRLLGESTRMVFMPDVEVQHEYYPTYLPYRRKKYRHGYLLGYFLAQHPQLSNRFVFERKVVKYYPWLQALKWLTAGGAMLLYVGEKIRYAPRPLHRWLYRWTYVDLRLSMYRGLLDFRRGKPGP